MPPTVQGGNIDINDLGVGSTLYLPVQVPGAMFFTGDPHMAQGDGEVALTAMEGSLRATFRLSVVKPGGPAPSVAFDGYCFGETAQPWLPIGLSDRDGPVDGQVTELDAAMKQAVRNAMAFLVEDLGHGRARRVRLPQRGGRLPGLAGRRPHDRHPCAGAQGRLPLIWRWVLSSGRQDPHPPMSWWTGRVFRGSPIALVAVERS